jgi:hypothetical protein
MSSPSKRPSLEGLIAVKGSAAPAIKAAPIPVPVPVPTPVSPEDSPPAPKLAAVPTAAEEDLVPLNFRVPAAFKRKFKTYAASHDMFLTELLKLSFEAYQKGQEA